jgi:hypothetical protein
MLGAPTGSFLLKDSFKILPAILDSLSSVSSASLTIFCFVARST